MKDLQILIDPKVMEKIQFWVMESTGEVSGLGKIEVHDNTFHVIDAILLDQENGAASTDIDAKAVGKAMFEMKDTEGDLNFWWHSHVNMSVYFSSTDQETIEQIGQHGYCVASVFNKKGEVYSGYYQGGVEGRPSFFVGSLPTRSGVITYQDEQDEWKAELDKKCRTKTYKATGLGKHGWTAPASLRNGRTLITGNYKWEDDKEWDHRKKEWVNLHKGLEPHEITCSKVPDEDFDSWYTLFFEFNGIEPLSGSQLDEFYEEWKGSIDGGQEATDSKYTGGNHA